MNEQNKEEKDLEKMASEMQLLEEGKDSSGANEKADVLEEPVGAPRKKRKTDYILEMGLFLVLGILIGISVKIEATKKFTIGFDDYKMKISSQQYDINRFQLEQLKKMQEDAKKNQDASNQNNPEQAPPVDGSQPEGGVSVEQPQP